MDDGREPLVFEAGSVPRSPKQSPRRRITAKCCLILAAVLGTLISAPILYIVATFSHGVVSSIRSPYAEIASEIGTVLPLIDSTSRFDVLATVWLDVTHHLSEGHSLPQDIKVVQYKQPNGQNKSEAILYSDLFFTNASMGSKLHSSQLIRFPVELLYTQPLGFSTLRATFQLMPHSPPTPIPLKSSELIYPTYVPIGPRSPHSLLLRGGETPATLNEALERSAVNINLIKLLPTKWQLNDTESILRSDYGEDPPMLDGAKSNRRFTRERTEGLIVDKKHRLLLPHIQTRSRVILVKEEQKFNPIQYEFKRQSWLSTYERDCKEFKEEFKGLFNPFPSDGKCQRQSKSSIFENKLIFANDDEGSTLNQTFYAPYLTQSVSASAQRHLQTIPRFSPLSRESDSTSTNAPSKDQCIIPMLETDKSGKYFQFDWDVFFSSHEHPRASAAENTYQHHYPDLQDFRDNGTEIRTRVSFAEDMTWSLQAVGLGDREHPRSKPKFFAFRMVFITAWHFINGLLSAFYWYTRATTSGVSWRAQWLFLVGAGAEAIARVLGYTKEGIRSLWIIMDLLSLAYTLVPAYFLLSTILHLEISQKGIIRRKANKKERQTRRLDEEIGWMLPIGLSLLHFLLVRYTSSLDIHVVSPQGCQDNGSGETNAETGSDSWPIFDQLSTALWHSSAVTQIIFNAQSKTFAGSFKIAAITTFATECFTLVTEHVESISGYQATRFPVVLGECYHFLICVAMAYQAVIYPGIPQTTSEDNDDDF